MALKRSLSGSAAVPAARMISVALDACTGCLLLSGVTDDQVPLLVHVCGASGRVLHCTALESPARVDAFGGAKGSTRVALLRVQKGSLDVRYSWSPALPGSPRLVREPESLQTINSATFASDGRLIASAVGVADKELVRSLVGWTPSALAAVRRASDKWHTVPTSHCMWPVGPSSSIATDHTVCVSADASKAATPMLPTALMVHDVRVRDTADAGACTMRSVAVHGKTPYSPFALSSDGQLLAYEDDDDYVRVVQIETGEFKRFRPPAWRLRLLQVAFLAKGTTLVTVWSDGSIYTGVLSEHGTDIALACAVPAWVRDLHCDVVLAAPDGTVVIAEPEVLRVWSVDDDGRATLRWQTCIWDKCVALLTDTNSMHAPVAAEGQHTPAAGCT